MPDYFTTPDKIKLLGNIKKVGDELIEPHLPLARIDVIDMIGDTNYTDYLAKAEGDPDRARIETAEGYFALAYVIPAINTVSTGAGIQRVTGFNESRIEILSESDIRERVDMYRDNAERLLSQYPKTVDKDKNDKPDQCLTPSIKMTVLDYEESDCS